MSTPKRRFTLLAVLATLILGTVAASAQSGLQNSPQAFTFTFDNCPTSGQQITGVTTSNNSAVFLDTSSNTVYVATKVTLTLTTGTVVVSLPFAAGHGQAIGLQDSTVTCTSEPISTPLGTATLTVTMFPAPPAQ